MFHLGYVLAFLILAVPMVASLAVDDGYASGWNGPGPLFLISMIAMLVFWLAMIIPGIAVTVRRLHDRDLSGWIYLGVIVANFIPLLNVVAALAFLVLMFLPGTQGDNRYGPDPKEDSTAGIFD